MKKGCFTHDGTVNAQVCLLSYQSDTSLIDIQFASMVHVAVLPVGNLGRVNCTDVDFGTVLSRE